MKKIVCIGGATTDIIVSPVDLLPSPRTLTNTERIEMHVGGCAANAAIVIRKLGLNSAIICKIGEDTFGKYVAHSCKNAGVDTRGIVVSKSSVTTGSIVCVSPNGERSFIYNPGSTADMEIVDINMNIVKESDIVFITSLFLTPKMDGKPYSDFLRECKNMGKFTVADTAWDANNVWLTAIEDIFEHLDLFMPSYDEAHMITKMQEPKKMADFFLERGVKTVVIKLGKDGALICESKKKKYIAPAWSGIKPVDTTGAGDSFCAGFLSGLAMGWEYNKCADFANAVGAHCVMAFGSQAGIKTMDEILDFMKRQEIYNHVITEVRAL